MTAFTLEVTDSGVQETLATLAARAGDLRPILQAIGEDIMERTRARFRTSVGPDGQRWRPNARATIEAYLARQGGFGKKGINKKGQTLAMGKRPLIGRSGSLLSQFHVHADAQAVTVGNSMLYAAIHQFGGQAGRGKKVAIPARPFLPVRSGGDLYPDERAKILATLNAYLAGR